MMKIKYPLVCLLGMSLSVVKIIGGNEVDVFSEKMRDVFADGGKHPFDTVESSVFSVDSLEKKEDFHVASLKKNKNKDSIKMTGERTSDAMLTITGNKVKVNSKIFSDGLCRDCLHLTQYLYFGTKRYAEDKRIYPGAFRKETNLPRPALYETLKKRNIEIFAPIFGTNGGKAGAYIGMLAYRRTAKHLELFVVFEGSQGEPFELFEGIGGASWRTNFQSDKVTVDAESLGLDKKYGKLSFHDGYYQKILTAKIFIEDELEKLFSHLNIKKFSEYNLSNVDKVTQDAIDKWRGYTVDCYIFGHSQGGGLTQIGAPYVTNLIGKLLYGNIFDNKTFNIAHAICMSPARAIGDEHTMEVIQEVMGKGNIFGWCSPIDIVPCLPLGYNANKRPAEKLGAIVGLKILGLISHFLPKKYSDFVSVISDTKFCYETLPIFAYVDYGDVLKKYCETGIKAYNELLKNNPAKSDRKQIQSNIKNLEKIKGKISEIRDTVKSMQENYFEAHTSNWVKSKYYALKAVHYMNKLLKDVPIGDLIGSQHWGAPVVLKNQDGKVWVESLFCSDLLDLNVQKDIDRGVEYEDHKNAIISK